MQKHSPRPRRLAVVPNRKKIIQPSPGFEKKQLSNVHVELVALCEFGCSYCSSNLGYYLRVNTEKFFNAVNGQIGGDFDPRADPALFLMYENVLADLERELDSKRDDYGRGQTLMFSQLTDSFSPELVRQGITIEALSLLLEHTQFRIRILTKSAAVAEPPFISMFRKHRDRFTVGLSIGSLDDEWAAHVESGTSPPSERVKAHRKLQDAGVPTFAMLCPVFLDQLSHVLPLLDALRANEVETVWCEPFNDRANWRHVRDRLPAGSPGRGWFDQAFSGNHPDLWSDYAATLYETVIKHARRNGWVDRLKFLLYEEGVLSSDAGRFGQLEGVLLQSKRNARGGSKNPAFAGLQGMKGAR